MAACCCTKLHFQCSGLVFLCFTLLISSIGSCNVHCQTVSCSVIYFLSDYNYRSKTYFLIITSKLVLELRVLLTFNALRLVYSFQGVTCFVCVCKFILQEYGLSPHNHYNNLILKHIIRILKYLINKNFVGVAQVC